MLQHATFGSRTDAQCHMWAHDAKASIRPYMSADDCSSECFVTAFPRPRAKTLTLLSSATGPHTSLDMCRASTLRYLCQCCYAHNDDKASNTSVIMHTRNQSTSDALIRHYESTSEVSHPEHTATHYSTAVLDDAVYRCICKGQCMSIGKQNTASEKPASWLQQLVINVITAQEV